MRISKIEVYNFRCLKSVKIACDNLTVLAGRNGSGKSSILNAIVTLFNPKTNPMEEDFYNRETNNPIEIKVTFTDFSSKEEAEFNSYVQNNKMVVTKIISYDNDSQYISEDYYSYKAQIPQFAKIRMIKGARDKTNALKELIADGTFEGLVGRPRSEAETLTIMEKYEQEHPDLTELVRTQVHFFGARNVGGGKLDKYTRFIFLPAVKEASEEVEGRDSSIIKLLDYLVLREIENRDDLVRFRDDIINRIVEKYSPDSLGGLDEISNSISTTLSKYFPGSELILNWNEVDPPQIDLPSVTCEVSEDGFEGCIERKGHGLQRALILSLLEHLALTSATTELSNEAAEPESSQETLRIDSILAIEEPEIYLHPSRARYLSKLLMQLANDSNSGSRTQVIYSTHSPYFVDLNRFNNLRLCRKIRKSQDPPSTLIKSYDLTSAAHRLEIVCSRSRNLANPEEFFRIKSAPIMNTIMNEGFFANLVVLVEGVSDVGAFWKVQEKMGKNWDKNSISLIPTNSKENFIKPHIIFNGLGIPTFIIFDKDNLGSRTNRALCRLFNIPDDNLPSEKIHETWAYNEPKLEDELKRMITEETYEEMWGQIEEELECDDSRIRKNPEAMSRLIEKIYDRGLSLPHFEHIVSKITELNERINT